MVTVIVLLISGTDKHDDGAAAVAGAAVTRVTSPRCVERDGDTAISAAVTAGTTGAACGIDAGGGAVRSGRA